MANWNLNKYYWPKESVERWWDLGWYWDSLLSKTCPHPDCETYADYYGETFSKTIRFDDPRPGKTGQISEWDYWHLNGEDRWLTPFAGKIWTPYHLPLYNPQNIEPSPKHPMYFDVGKWENADYNAFILGLKVRMKNGSFCKNAPLTGIVISPNANLSLANTSVFADFSGACFGSGIKLDNTCFGDSTDFFGAIFSIGVNFSYTKFGSHIDFSNTYFGIGTDFSNTVFSDNIDFTNAVFSIRVNFSSAAFGSVNFTTHRKESYEKKINQASFADTKFFGDVNFSGRLFTGKSNFHGATFQGLTKFYDAELSEETYFTLNDKNWPLPPANIEKAADVASFEEYEKAFCCLKKIQQGHEARTAEHFFYKLELKARMRRSDIRWTEKFAAGAYGLFSDYGESIGRPLAWLLVSFLIATAVTCCAALPFWQDFAPDNLGFAATAAWHNLVPGGFIKDVFLGCHDEACRSYRYGEWSDHLLTRWGFSLYVVTGLFAAFNLALWFLFGLALKRRFQIK